MLMIADSFRTRRDILFCLPLNDGILPNQGSQAQQRTRQQHIATGGSHFDEEMCLTGCHISHTHRLQLLALPVGVCGARASMVLQDSPDAAGQPDRCVAPRGVEWGRGSRTTVCEA